MGDLRWHAWHCAICDKRGYGLRFGCVECREANLCVACKKTGASQKEEAAMSHSSMVHEEAKTDEAKVIAENAAAPGIEAAPKNGKRSRRERPVDSACKSVLSLQPTGTSSAAQLLGGLAHQGGAAGSTQRRARMGQGASASVLSVKHTSSSTAAGLLGPLLEQKIKC